MFLMMVFWAEKFILTAGNRMLEEDEETSNPPSKRSKTRVYVPILRIIFNELEIVACLE